MKFQSFAVFGIVIAISSTTQTAINPLTFCPLSYTSNSAIYCASTQNTAEVKPDPEASKLCKSLQANFILAPANETSGECECRSWLTGATNAVACNCDSCAPLSLNNFDHTCVDLVESCMTDAKEGMYEGGYIEKWGEGGRGYLSVHTKGEFAKPGIVASCIVPASAFAPETTATRPEGDEDEDVMLDLEWDVPSDMIQIIEETVYLGIVKDIKDVEKDRRKELKELEEKKKAEEAATRKNIDAELKAQMEKDKAELKKQKKETKEEAATVKAVNAKYYRRFRGLEGKTEKEWIIQLKEERRKPNFRSDGMIYNDPVFLALCKMGWRRVCVVMAKYSVVEPYYDPPT